MIEQRGWNVAHRDTLRATCDANIRCAGVASNWCRCATRFTDQDRMLYRANLSIEAHRPLQRLLLAALYARTDDGAQVGRVCTDSDSTAPPDCVAPDLIATRFGRFLPAVMIGDTVSPDAQAALVLSLDLTELICARLDHSRRRPPDPANVHPLARLCDTERRGADYNPLGYGFARRRAPRE